MRPRTLYLLGTPLTPQEHERHQKLVPQINTWARACGYDDVFVMANDEWKDEKLSAERESMKSVVEAGGKVFVAVEGPGFFDRVGDVLHRPVLKASTRHLVSEFAHNYSKPESFRHMHEIGRAGSFKSMIGGDYRAVIDAVHRLGRKIFTYMNPLAGQPLPDLQRRNEGLGLWRCGFDGTMTWVYTHYDSDPLNQRLAYGMVYRTEGGVVDTLHWEGFRERVDDVRYLTTLLDTLGDCVGRHQGEDLVGETYAWLREVDIARGDLDTVRREMARRTVALLALGVSE